MKMDFLNEIDGYINKLKVTLGRIDTKEINRFANVLLDHYQRDSHIFIFGNGGSGATASHAVCDLNKGTCVDLDKKFKFVCLNDNMASILAYSNDVSYEDIFYLQLKNYLTPDDLVIGISGSGNSTNVVKAITYAKQKGAGTFTLCGYDGGRLKEIDRNNCIHVPVEDMQVAEDCHLSIIHIQMQIFFNYLKREETEAGRHAVLN